MGRLASTPKVVVRWIGGHCDPPRGGCGRTHGVRRVRLQRDLDGLAGPAGTRGRRRPGRPGQGPLPGPAAGSSPVQIVQGFLRAGAASDQEYEVARSFMTPSPDTTWRPDTSILIYTDDTAVTVSALDESTVRARAKVVASIDGNGRYRDLPAGTVAEATFRLQQAGGSGASPGCKRASVCGSAPPTPSGSTTLPDPLRLHVRAPAGARHPLVPPRQGPGHPTGPSPAG